MMRLSVLIITYNEARNIVRCLESVKDLADEIVVVDSFSTDNTEELCKPYRVKFLQRAFDNYTPQKNYALAQASHPLVLSLDADEALDETLQQEIRFIKQRGAAGNFYLKRLTNYCGQWIYHCGWYPDKKLRLWDKAQGCWQGDIHERVELYDKTAEAVTLRGNIHHYSYYTREEHYRKTEKYAQIMAEYKYRKNPGTWVYPQIWLKPVQKFLYGYIYRLGLLDGKAGYQISKIAAYGAYLKYKNIRVLQRMNTHK